MSFTLKYIKFLHELENHIQLALTQGDETVTIGVNDDGEPDVIYPEPKDIVEKLQLAHAAIGTIGPIIRMVEEYLEGDIDDSVLRKRWSLVASALEEKDIERNLYKTEGQVTEYLKQYQNKGQ